METLITLAHWFFPLGFLALALEYIIVRIVPRSWGLIDEPIKVNIIKAILLFFYCGTVIAIFIMIVGSYLRV